jgi:hypothetical protein
VPRTGRWRVAPPVAVDVRVFEAYRDRRSAVLPIVASGTASAAAWRLFRFDRRDR